jgi:hypothetical protein
MPSRPLALAREGSESAHDQTTVQSRTQGNTTCKRCPPAAAHSICKHTHIWSLSGGLHPRSPVGRRPRLAAIAGPKVVELSAVQPRQAKQASDDDVVGYIEAIVSPCGSRCADLAAATCLGRVARAGGAAREHECDVLYSATLWLCRRLYGYAALLTHEAVCTSWASCFAAGARHPGQRIPWDLSIDNQLV